MSHPFMHILCVCLGFFKAGWSKKADPFKFSKLQPGQVCQGRGKGAFGWAQNRK